jgi:hypothetical protein
MGECLTLYFILANYQGKLSQILQTSVYQSLCGITLMTPDHVGKREHLYKNLYTCLL